MNPKDRSTETATKRKKGYLLLSLVFAVLGMIGQTVVVLYGYDASMRVFRQNSVLGTLVGWGLFLMCAVLLSALFTLKGRGGRFAESDHLTAFFSALGGGVLPVASLVIAIECQTSGGSLATVSALMAAFSLPSGAYLLLQAFRSGSEKRRTLLTVFGFFPVLWGITALLRLYFDNTSAINDPLRLLLQCALIAVMLAFLSELKMRVGKKGEPLFYAASGAALVLSSAAAVSQVILRVVVTTVPTGEFLLSITALCLSLYLFVRMWQLTKPTEDSAENITKETV